MRIVAAVVLRETMPVPNRIDYAFLSSLEGGSKTDGYVPAAAISRSGVTIATGFDLGQREEAELVRLGFPPHLIVRLKPYLGLQGAIAQQHLVHHPLRISRGEASTIDRAVKSEHVSRLERKYLASAANAQRATFYSLPAEAQTVIASVSFQYGVNLDIRTPRFWRAVTAQDWGLAARELDSFGDAYPTRRRREADLLRRIAP